MIEQLLGKELVSTEELTYIIFLRLYRDGSKDYRSWEKKKTPEATQVY